VLTMVMILSRITGTNSEVEPSRYATLGPPNTINHTLKLDHCVRDQIGGLQKALVARCRLEWVAVSQSDELMILFMMPAAITLMSRRCGHCVAAKRSHPTSDPEDVWGISKPVRLCVV